MQVVMKRIVELKHMPGNTRLHSEKQIREYIRSIKMFGQLRPMVIDENNIVLAGNGLLMALRKMGKETAACHIVTGLTENEKKKLMLADNKIAALGEEDQFAFEEALRELSGDIDIPGYGAEILKNMTSDLKVIDALGEEKSKPEKIKLSAQIAVVKLRGRENAEKSKATLPIRRLPEINGINKWLLRGTRKNSNATLR